MPTLKDIHLKYQQDMGLKPYLEIDDHFGDGDEPCWLYLSSDFPPEYKDDSHTLRLPTPEYVNYLEEKITELTKNQTLNTKN